MTRKAYLLTDSAFERISKRMEDSTHMHMHGLTFKGLRELCKPENPSNLSRYMRDVLTRMSTSDEKFFQTHARSVLLETFTDWTTAVDLEEERRFAASRLSSHLSLSE